MSAAPAARSASLERGSMRCVVVAMIRSDLMFSSGHNVQVQGGGGAGLTAILGSGSRRGYTVSQQLLHVVTSTTIFPTVVCSSSAATSV